MFRDERNVWGKEKILDLIVLNLEKFVVEGGLNGIW